MKTTELTEATADRYYLTTLGQMTSNIAHELSNPLTILQARSYQMSQLLDDTSLDAEKMKAVLQSLQRSADQITTQLKALQNFSRHMAEEDNFHFVQLQVLLDNLKKLFTIRFPHFKGRLEIAPCSDEIEIECCPHSLQMAFLYILTNSVEAISECAEDAWIHIKIADLEENKIALDLIDSGCGTDACPTELFTPTYTTKHERQALGLGLPLAKQIVSKHQGQIEFVCPKPTTVRVTLPRWRSTENQ